MKKNKIIPFSLLFITLTFLELFCIVKYSDVFYFPLAIGATMLGSAYLLLNEIMATISSFLKEKEEKAKEINANEAYLAEKEEAAKLAKATYVIEKRILNLLEERLLLPEENIENLSNLQYEVVRAIKASIKYDIKNTNHIADVISDSSNTQADITQILAKFDAIALELKSNQLTMNAVKEQLFTITDIARQVSNNRVKYVNPATHIVDNTTANNVPAPEITATEYSEAVNKEALDETVSNITAAEEPIYSGEITAKPEAVAEEAANNNPEITTENEETITTSELEDTANLVDTLTTSEAKPAATEEDPNKKMSPEDIAALFAAASEAVSESEPTTSSEPKTEQTVAPVNDDPNKQMSPEDIAALFAASKPQTEPAITPVNDDPNKQMSPEDIAALFAASKPQTEPAETTVTEDPNKKMSPEDIAALFSSANLALEPEPSAPAPKTAIEALSKPKPEVTPVSDDPNKKMSPEDIAALFASAGQ